MARERSKLARQLHDEVASAMFAAKLELEVAAHLATKGASIGTVRATLDDAAHSANQALATIRRICSELREFGSEDVDLFGELTQLLRAFARKTGTQCLFSVRGNCSSLMFDVNASTKVLRTIREKLADIAATAGARRVQVDIIVSQRQIDLKIRMQTTGIPPERKITEDGLRPGSRAKKPEPRAVLAAAEPGSAHNATFAVKIPRGSLPKAQTATFSSTTCTVPGGLEAGGSC